MDNLQSPEEDKKLLESPPEELRIEAPDEEKLLPASTTRNTKGIIIKILLGFVGACILFSFLFLGYLFIHLNSSDTTPVIPEDTQPACTLEAKICPDGSTVGREGPNCEFAECPLITPERN